MLEIQNNYKARFLIFFMVISEIKNNLSDFLVSLPPALSVRVDNLFTIVKAAGIAFIIYVIYLLVRFIFTWKRYKKLKVIEKKIDKLDRKSNNIIKILKKTKKKR